MNEKYVCNHCGHPASFDAMRSWPVLICDCKEGEWIDEKSKTFLNDGRGGYFDPSGPKPVLVGMKLDKKYRPKTKTKE